MTANTPSRRTLDRRERRARRQNRRTLLVVLALAVLAVVGWVAAGQLGAFEPSADSLLARAADRQNETTSYHFTATLRQAVGSGSRSDDADRLTWTTVEADGVGQAPDRVQYHVSRGSAGTDANDEVNVDTYLVGDVRILVTPNRRDPVRGRLQVVYLPEPDELTRLLDELAGHAKRQSREQRDGRTVRRITGRVEAEAMERVFPGKAHATAEDALEVELWLRADDDRLVALNLRGTSGGPPATAATTPNGYLRHDLALQFDRFNEPVEIKLPVPLPRATPAPSP